MHDQETPLDRFFRYLKESPHAGLQVVAGVTVLTLVLWGVLFRYESVERDTVSARASATVDIPRFGKSADGRRDSVWPVADPERAKDTALAASGAAGSAAASGAPDASGGVASARQGSRAGSQEGFPGDRPKAPQETSGGLNGAFTPSGNANQPGSGASFNSQKIAADPAGTGAVATAASNSIAGRASHVEHGSAAMVAHGHGRGLGAKGAVGRGTLGAGGNGNYADDSEDGSEYGHSGIGGSGAGSGGGASSGAGGAGKKGAGASADSSGGGASGSAGVGWSCGDGSVATYSKLLKNGKASFLEAAGQAGFSVVTRLNQETNSALPSAEMKMTLLRGSLSSDASFFGQYDPDAAAQLEVFSEAVTVSLTRITSARLASTALTTCLTHLHAGIYWPATKPASSECHQNGAALFMEYDGLNAVISRLQTEHTQRTQAIIVQLEIMLADPFLPKAKRIWAQSGIARLLSERSRLSEAQQAVSPTLWAGLGSATQRVVVLMPAALSNWLVGFKKARDDQDKMSPYYWTFQDDAVPTVRESLAAVDSDSGKAADSWQAVVGRSTNNTAVLGLGGVERFSNVVLPAGERVVDYSSEGQRPIGITIGDNLSLYSLFDLNRAILALEPSVLADARCKLGYPAPKQVPATVNRNTATFSEAIVNTAR
jgi:hypothetical protein